MLRARQGKTHRAQRDGIDGRAATPLLMILLVLLGFAGSFLYFQLRRPEPTAPGQAHETASGHPASSDAGNTAGTRPAGPTAEPQESTPIASLTRRIADQRINAIVRASERAGPSVVSVVVTQTRLVRTRRPSDPFDLFFQSYLPEVQYEPESVPSIGSGLIVDESGIILTNEHVVRGANQIQVVLTDGKKLDAQLVGSDPNYDLAVLKVGTGDEELPLPAAEIGDSDSLVVGEWAIAIGNPYGLFIYDDQPTVTVGVISAIHRNVRESGQTRGIYKDMIQTDAAINPGNSGGPLVNSLGQVVGLNTFIFTENGGSLGMGFAIPINTAVRVATDLVRHGRTQPIEIGIYAKEISHWLAAQLSIDDPRGLIISGVDAGSPADKAGIQVLDIIRAVNGKPVTTPRQAIRTIFGAQVGDTIRFAIEREGKHLEIPLVVEAAHDLGNSG
jgi:serine protease Do